MLRPPVLLLLGLLCAAGRAALPAEPYAWGNVVVRGGGYVTGLVFHPAAPDLLYARTDVGGAYRWDAARRAWIPLTDFLDRTQGDHELYGVLSLALDPHDPARVYLACGEYVSEWARSGAVLRSSDRGATWAGVDLPCKLGGNQDGRGMGERLAVDPHDGRILYLGTSHDGLWRSADAAQHWRPLPGLRGDAGITFVLFDPASGHDGRPTPVLYAGLDDPTRPVLYRSDDGGGTWEAVAGQPTGLLVHHAAVDDAGVLYLAYGNAPGPNDVTAGAVWKYEPATRRWTDITPVKPDTAADKFGYSGLALDPGHPGVILATTLDRWGKGDEVFRSTDGGGTWTPLLAHSKFDPAGAPYVQSLHPHWVSHVALDPFHPGRTWIVTGYGLWVTDLADTPAEGGATHTWVFPNQGLEETVVDMLVSPPEGAPLLSAMGDLGGFRHDHLAVSPQGGLFQPFHGSCPGLDFAQLAPRLMVRTHWGPARGAWSEDGGATWTDFASSPEAAGRHGPGMAAISADGRRLVWLPKGAHPFYSTDRGSTWTESRTKLTAPTSWDTYGPVADRVNPLKFYIYDSVQGDFYASTDGGATFQRLRSLPAGGGQLKAEPGAEGRLWLPTGEGLLVSEDGGRSFHALPGVTDSHQVGFGAPAPGRTEPAVFLDGKVRGQAAFFRSDDRGRTWVRLSDERLRLGWIKTLTGDARVYGRVYLGTSGRGIMVGEPLKR